MGFGLYKLAVRALKCKKRDNIVGEVEFAETISAMNLNNDSLQ